MDIDMDWGAYPALSADIHWGVVKAKFVCDDALEEGLVSNVTILPFSDDCCVIFQVADGSWELPGGTLEPGEGIMEALRREVGEELGAELLSYRVFGQFRCESSAAGPYRPHIPHPRFIRAVGYGEVRLAFEPLNPEGGEQVIAVKTVELDEAVRIFTAQGRGDIADLYRLAHEVRMRDREERRD